MADLPGIRPSRKVKRMSTLEMILEDLRTLPSPKLEEAAALIHGLRARAPNLWQRWRKAQGCSPTRREPSWSA